MSKPNLFALWFKGNPDSAWSQDHAAQWCEVDGGTCYMVYLTREAAEKDAREANADCGHDRYEVRVFDHSMPHGDPLDGPRPMDTFSPGMAAEHYVHLMSSAKTQEDIRSAVRFAQEYENSASEDEFSVYLAVLEELHDTYA